jgi:hypothetical protein
MRYLENMKAIVRHFTSRLNQLSHINTSPLSADQVLEIIRNNYSTLKLKLLPNLEVYEEYLENPHSVSFFRNYLRTLIGDVRTSKQQ